MANLLSGEVDGEVGIFGIPTNVGIANFAVSRTFRRDFFWRRARKMRAKNQALFDKRKNVRVDISASVDVIESGNRIAFGRLLNISSDGFAFHTDGVLKINKRYKFHIHGIGGVDGTVLRRFDATNYSVLFENTEAEKKRLEDILSTAPGGVLQG